MVKRATIPMFLLATFQLQIMFEQKNNIENCDHVQMGGQAFYDERKYFMFTPEDPLPGLVARFRSHGVAQQMADGTFDFVRKPQLKAKSKLIKKLAHGRASETKDGAIQLTIKVYCNEGVNISETIGQEAAEAARAIREWTLSGGAVIRNL